VLYEMPIDEPPLTGPTAQPVACKSRPELGRGSADAAGGIEVTSLRDTLQSALSSTYAIDRELGGGGMSRVFLATESALDRSVVLKVLPPELAPAFTPSGIRTVDRRIVFENTPSTVMVDTDVN
jgi:hypothetical protein